MLEPFVLMGEQGGGPEPRPVAAGQERRGYTEDIKAMEREAKANLGNCVGELAGAPPVSPGRGNELVGSF